MPRTAVLGLLALALFSATQAIGPIRNLSGNLLPVRARGPVLAQALGASRPDAPLLRRPARDIRVQIDANGFEVSGPKVRVSLEGVGTGTGRWARYEVGFARKTSFGRETVVVAPRKAEQFLTVDGRHGTKTWRWRLGSPSLTPRIGDDGAVGFRSGHHLAGVHIEPVTIFDGAGRDVTPRDARWSLARDRSGWLLELRLDDSHLPTPYVIDPAIVLRSAATSAQNAGGSTSLTLYKPIGVAPNDFLLAAISIHGTRTITPPAGWTSVRRDTQGTNLTQEIFYKVAGANEPGTYQFTFSASDRATGGILPYLGVDNSNPIDVSSGNPSASNSANVVALSVTPSAANHLVVGIFGLNSNKTFTPPGGMNEEWDTKSNATSTEAADYTAAAGATGNKTAVASGSQAWIGQLVALRLDIAAPTQTLSVAEGTRPDLQYFNSGTNTMYYNPAAAGDFTVTSTVTDAGPSRVTFPAIAATGFTHTAAYRAQVLADEPRAYWRLGESSGTSAADTGPNGNTGTYTGGVTLGAVGALVGDSDTAASFDGVDNTVSVPDAASLKPAELTVEAWVKSVAGNQNWAAAVLKASDDNWDDGYGLFAYPSSGEICFFVNSYTGAVICATLTQDQWTHIVGVFDGSTLRLYRNGVQAASIAYTTPISNSAAQLFIGRGAGAGYYWKGQIDDVAIYQTALSATRILEHYNVGISSNRDEIDTSSPFSSAPYRFGQTNTTAPPAQTITGLDGAGASVTTTLTFVRDVTPPSGMSATVTGGYYTSTSIPVTLNNGTDTGSGVDSTTGILERDEVVLSADSCPAFTGAWATVVLSGGNDTTVQSGKCYRYRYTISDRVTNQAVQAGTSATAKVDTSAPAPAPTLAYGSFSNAALVGGFVYYRPGASSGQFAVTGSGSSDGESGISGYVFPAAAGGWSRSTTSTTATYSHTGSPTDPAEPLNVTAQNNAGLSSAATGFTVTPDATVPTGQSLALSGGPYYTAPSVPLTPTNGSDTGSGLDLTSRIYERDVGMLSGNSCSGFPGTYATTVSNPDTTVTSGRCYRYRLKISDLVGNQSAPSSPTADAKIDTSAPSNPTFAYSSFSNAAATGGVVYYRTGAASGQFAVTATSTDAESGIAGYTFAAAASGWSRSIAGATATYSHTGSPTDPVEPSNVTAQNNAGLVSGATSFTVTPDSSLPSTTIQCNGAACAAGWYTSSPVSVTLPASDTGSGVSQIKYTTDGSDPTLANGIVYAGAFNVAATITVKYRAWDNVGNTEAVHTQLIRIDASAPSAPTLAYSALTNAAVTGGVVYFRPGVAGGLTVTASSTDGESGVASYAFPALGSGWSGTPTGASDVYTFSTSAADPVEPLNVTAANNAGLTSSPGALTVTPDASAPVSSILCNGSACGATWYSVSVSVSLSASDSGSGLLQIRYTTDGSDPSPVNGTIYSAPFGASGTMTVRFRAYDKVGNEEAVGSQLVRVDTTAPAAPGLTLGETPASPSQSVSGTTLYYNPQGGNSGTFTVDAAASDAESGIEKATFPAITGMTGGGDDTTSPYQGVYSWTASTSASGAQSVTARNNAGLTSGATSFTVTADTSVPTGQTAALVGGPYFTTASVGFTSGNGSDSSSGIDVSSRLVQRASAILSNGACTGSFSGFSGSYSTPDTSVVSGNCYRYRFTVADNVGNVSAAIVTADAKVDTSAATGTMNDPGANLRGTVALTSTTSDPESGVATVTYQRSPAGQNTWAATAASWNTTLVADDLYDVRVVVTNGAGTTMNSALVANRRVDNTVPSASMDNPGTPLSNPVTLTATASDAGSGLDTGTFQYSLQGTGPWTTIGIDSSAPFSVDWNTTPINDGRYSLRVIVTDLAGNSHTSSQVDNRQVANYPPIVNITSPGDYVNAASPSPFTITTTNVADQTGVANIEFFRCDNASVNCSTGSFVSIGIDFLDPYTGSWAQASEPEGNRSLKTIVTEVSLATGVDVINVTIDRTAPTGSVTAPATGAAVSRTVNVDSDSADSLSGVAEVVFQRSPTGAGTWTAIGTDTSSPYSVGWDTTALGDGAYDLRAVTTDLAGNSFTSGLRTVTVDNTAPGATQDDPGANLRMTVNLTGSASDTNGIAQVGFERSPAGGGSWTAIGADSTSPYSTSFDTTAVGDGLYDLRAVATDNAGNVTSSTPVTNRRVDNTAPSSTMTSPGANLRATVSLDSTTGDGGSGMASVRYERSPAGAGTWTAIGTSSSPPYSLDFDTTSVADGLYDLRAVATDVVGNQTTSAAATGIRVDNTPPTATMNDPGANLSGTIGLTSSASDGGSGIDTVTYQYSQAGLNSWTSTPASWNTAAAGDGLYDLHAIATDLAGNSTTSAPVVNRRVDNGAPDVSITSPATYVNGGDADPFTVIASSPDTDLSGIELFACDNASAGCATGSWVSLGTDPSAPYSASWALPAADGSRALRAVATDLALNTGTQVVNVTIDRAPPSGGSVSYVDGDETTGSIAITTADGTDSGTGVNPATGVIQRDAVSFSGNACGSFAGSWTAVTSPDTVASGNCVRYRYSVADFAGNPATYPSGDVAEVDTSAPSAPTLVFSALTNAAASGQTVYFRPGTAGGFTVTASSSDAESGISSYSFPALGSGWSGSQSGTDEDYTFSSSAADPAEPNDATAQNNAGLNSNPAGFTVTPDSSAPASSIACDGAACTAGWYTSAVSVSLSASDAAAGLQEIRYTTDGSDPSPVNGTVYSAPFSLSDTTTVRFRAYDRVGNEETIDSQLVLVDTSAPAAPSLSYGAFQNAALAGGVIWYRPGASAGQFAVTAASSDAESGIAGYGFTAAAAGWSRSVSGATATYSHTGAPGDPAEPNDVTAQNNAGLDSSPTSFTADPDAGTPTSTIACDASACSAGWYPASVSVSLSATDAASGLAEIRYTTDGSDPSPSNGTVYSAPFSVATTTTVKFRGYDRVGNEEAVGSQLVRLDTSDPSAPALTLAEAPASAGQHVSGTTLFYNPQTANTGTFTVSADAADPDSGIERVSFPSLTGMTGGGDDFTNPYQTSYDWTASSSASGAQSVTARNDSGLSSTGSFTVAPDTTPPSGQTVDNDGGPYYTTTAVPLTLVNGSDAASGLDASTGVVERQSATLADDSCGSWSGWSPVSLVGTDDTSVLSGNCYRYRYSISDNVGNQSSPSPASGTAKLDTSEPAAPGLAFSALTSAVASGQTVYFRPDLAGGFTVTGSSADAESGIAGYTFPALGSGWSDTPAGASDDYSFSAGADDPVEPNEVNAQNNAGLDSNPAGFTVTPDASAPASAIACDAAACSAGWYTSSVSVGLSASDPGSGLAEIRYTTDGSDPSPVNGTVYSSPFSLGVTTSVRFRSYDLLGNEEPVDSQLVRIDTSAPVGPALGVAESPASPSQHVSGTTLYYNPSGGNAGSFSVDAASNDPESGIERVSFPALGGFAGGGDDPTSPYQALYSWSASSSASGAQSVSARNNAGLSANASFTVTPDTGAPSGGSVDYPNGYSSGPVAITTDDGTDALSGVNAGSGQIERDSATLAAGSCSSFASSWSAVSSPDSTIASGNCYRYRYRVSDNVGNEAIYGSPNVVKVSSTGPAAPALTLSETPASAGQHVSGTTIFYNPQAAWSGSFGVTADTSDPGSGIDRVNFPSLTGMSGGGDDTTSPYQGSYGWTAASAASGLQTVTVRNNAGLTATGTFTVTPDTAPPSGQSADLNGGPYFTTLFVPLTLVNGSDAVSGLDASTGAVERQSATLADDTCGSWSGWSPVSLVGTDDTSVLSGNCYRYRYSISDNVGNQSSPSPASGTAKVDVSAPATTDDAPAGWANVPLTVTLTPADSGSGVASTAYRVDGGSFQSGVSVPVSAPADHSNDGVHTISYRSTDRAGNVESLRSAAVRIDTTLPITTDDAPSGWHNSAVTVALTASDALSGVGPTQYRVDGASFQSGTSIVVAAPADHSNDGVHTLEYQSADNAGNVEPLETATVRIDTTLPAGSVSAPAAGAHVNGVVPVSAAASDVHSGVVSVEFRVRPSGSGSFATISTDLSAPYDAAWDSTTAPEGNAELEVVVLDNAANSATSAIRTVVVDNPPTPTLGDPGAALAGTVTLNASSQADTTQIVFERRLAGSGSWTAIATDNVPPFSADFDTTSVGDENYEFRAIATDGGGFSGTSPLRTSRVDNTAPSVAVSDPADGAVVGGPSVQLGASASDLGAGVASVRFETRPVGSGAFAVIGTDTTAPYEASWDASALSGDHELRAVATDAAGNPATSISITVSVDASVPSVTLSDPGSLVRGAVGLAASAPHAAVASVAFGHRRAGADSWTSIAVDDAPSWGAIFDTLTVADGLYDLRAQALDGSGNVLATHVRESIRIDNTAPKLVSSTPADGATLETVTAVKIVASEPVAAVRAAGIDGSALTAAVSGAGVTFATGSLRLGKHRLTATLEDAAGNAGPVRLRFTVKGRAHAALVVRLGETKTNVRGKQQVFLVPLSVSARISVRATLFSPTGRRLVTLRTQLRAGSGFVRIVVPRASLPPGRYTIVIVATGAGQRVVKRVQVTIDPERAAPAANEPISSRSEVVPASDPAAAAPAAATGTHTDPQPPASERSATPLEQPKANVSPQEEPKRGAISTLETVAKLANPKHSHSVGVIFVLLALGGGIAFLIRFELRRLLAWPRHRGPS